MDFICNICGAEVRDCPIERIDREISSCPQCGSTVRVRSIIHLLSLALLGRSLPIPEFPYRRKNIVGLGMSDWQGYAEPLAEMFDYTNTFLHTQPFYDVALGDAKRAGTCDFVISTDVFEHVTPPVDDAFDNVFALLKPGGHFIFSVPWTTDAQTDEHFPAIFEYRVVRFGDQYVVVNRTRDGAYELYEHPIFHGGAGETLEMRLFCEAHLWAQLTRAGFTDIRVLTEAVPEYGILPRTGMPFLARRP